MSKQGYFYEHWENNDHASGISSGRGWTIIWDPGNTPTKFALTCRIVRAVIDRIEFYQDGKFACDENQKAIHHLLVAEKVLGGGECSSDSDHWLDVNGNPAGGYNKGAGFLISWQNGPLGKIGSPERKEPNGAFVEDIIDTVSCHLDKVRDRFDNPEILETAIVELKNAGIVLDSRTQRRTEAKTEGTHEGN